MREAEWTRGEYRISTDPDELDLDVIHTFLTKSYWADGIDLATVRRSIAGSLSFGLFHGEQQVGFARVVSDLATFAYLCDVFVLPPHTGQGLGTWLCGNTLQHPDLQGLRRWMLATRDAHRIYAAIGFTPLSAPATFMQILRPEIYRSALS